MSAQGYFHKAGLGGILCIKCIERPFPNCLLKRRPKLEGIEGIDSYVM